MSVLRPAARRLPATGYWLLPESLTAVAARLYYRQSIGILGQNPGRAWQEPEAEAEET